MTDCKEPVYFWAPCDRGFFGFLAKFGIEIAQLRMTYTDDPDVISRLNVCRVSESERLI
jgi:hypothetical protein